MISGQITLTSSGVMYAGPALDGNSFAFKGHPSNTGVVYLGNVDDTVTTSNGYPISANEVLILEVSNLNYLKFISAAAGQKVCWIRLEV